MDLIHAENTVDYEGTVVSLGNFDGLHTAHMKIIKRGIEIAKKRGLKSGVLLFNDNTKNVISGGKKVKLLMTNDEKLKLLEDAGVDFVYTRDFTPEFMRLTPEEFVRRLLKNLKARVVCVGYDYSFGYMARGNTETLRSLGRGYGFDVSVTDKVIIDDKVVSSTYIRELIKNGDTERVRDFLGRYYSLGGTVEKGLQNGRKMGFPTANVDYNTMCAIPKEGVYYGISEVLGERYKSVINVGKNLTFGADRLTLESHLLNFDDDIYGEKIRIYFIKRLRDTVRFDSAAELKKQIAKDVEQAERISK